MKVKINIAKIKNEISGKNSQKRTQNCYILAVTLVKAVMVVVILVMQYSVFAMVVVMVVIIVFVAVSVVYIVSLGYML